MIRIRVMHLTGARLAGLLGLTGLAIVGLLLTPASSLAHPLGNFSISQYTGIRVKPDGIELRYLIDMAEIPTFQEIQGTAIVPEPGHPSLSGYLAQKVERLKEGLFLEVDGRRLPLQAESKEVIFPPGAGGLPTLKLGVRYRATFPSPTAGGPRHLHYRDGNFANRAGWKEIVAIGERGITVASSSVPEKDRSQELADYPTDLLNSPPQDLEARIVFVRDQSLLAAAPSAQSDNLASGEVAARERAPVSRSQPPFFPTARTGTAVPGDNQAEPELKAVPPTGRAATGSPSDQGLPGLQPNKQGTPRNAFTELLVTQKLSFGVIVIALAVAAALGAFHALEPGHGKTVVAAYLVGSRGTARQAVLLGLIVTASHTAGVYLLGAITLYASRYVVPERLYPWLGAVSGLAIAMVGFILFLRRYAQLSSDHSHAHSHEHGHAHGHGHHHHHPHGPEPHSHDSDHTHDDHPHPHPEPGRAVALPGLVALGVSGGIVPCPAALVVLLSALSLNRVGFGLLLIVAFSVGLAAVLIAIGILMVYAGRFMARFHGDGPLVQRWLPLASSALITIFGVAIGIQALMTAGILQIRF